MTGEMDNWLANNVENRVNLHTTEPCLYADLRGARWRDVRTAAQYRVPWAPVASQNSEWLTLLATLFDRNGPLWKVWGLEISMREPDFEPLSWFEPPLFWVKKSELECSKNHKKHPVDRPKMHVV